jgi:hypothetical protein
MLAPDKDNLKAANWGVDLPGTWKWKDVSSSVKHKDKADRNNLLHSSAKTDAEGYAKKDALLLSRFGGDKFRPAAYIDQDPHLAKYVHGHTDLEKKKPVFAAKSITVWRKFWYQVVKVEGLNSPGMGGAEGQYLRVKADMEKCTDLEVARATVNGMNPQAIYPMYMVRLNGGNADALVVSDSNKAQFFGGFAPEADKPVKVPILVCDAQWDIGGNSGAKDVPATDAANFPLDITMDKLVLSPPLQGGSLFVSGTWKAYELVAGAEVNVRTAALTDADLSVNPNRANLKAVTINLPAGVGPTTPDTKIEVQQLVVQGAKGPYLGEYSSATKRILVVYKPISALFIADFQNTVAHEVGHAFSQTSTALPAGIPAHPHQYESQGSHCSHDTDKCLMYATGPIVGSLNRYCDVCHPYVLVQNFSRLK